MCEGVFSCSRFFVFDKNCFCSLTCMRMEYFLPIAVDSPFIFKQVPHNISPHEIWGSLICSNWVKQCTNLLNFAILVWLLSLSYEDFENRRTLNITLNTSRIYPTQKMTSTKINNKQLFTIVDRKFYKKGKLNSASWLFLIIVLHDMICVAWFS